MEFCQSCGMPMEDKNLYGDDADGNKSKDYCSYCYAKGEFLQDVSMQEMIEHCIPYLLEAKVAKTGKEVEKMMQGFFPQLKRWSKS